MRAAWVGLGIAAIAVVACSRSNPTYCGGAPLATCSDAGGCGSDADCSGSAAVCDPTSHACVECTTSEPSACSGTTPTCAADSCVGCGSDTDCPTENVCLVSGACAPPSAVMFVASTGADTTCSPTDPCTLATAIDNLTTGDDRAVLWLSLGGYVMPAVTFTHDIEIIGRGATLSAGAADAPVISTTAGTTRLDFVTLTGATGMNGDAVQCFGSDAGVALFRATVIDNAGMGVNTNGCTVSVLRSTIALNANGGVLLSLGSFDVENNFIVLNGSGGAFTPGAQLQPAAGSNTFIFNTVAYNNTSPNSVFSPGISCSNVPIAISQSIATANNDGSADLPAQTVGCTASFVYPSPGSQTSNDLGFVSIGGTGSAFDFHLTAASPTTVKDVVNDICTGIDFDGDTRPQGRFCDLGADEVREP